MKFMIFLSAMASVVWFMVGGETMVGAETAQDAVFGLFCDLLGLLSFCVFAYLMAREASK